MKQPTSKNIKRRNKGNQKKRFYKYLLKYPSTCTQVSTALQIPQKCCTRYKRQLESLRLLAVVKLVKCPITGEHGVQLLTTDEKLFPNRPKQLPLWK